MKHFLSRMEYPCTVDDLRHQAHRESLEDVQLIDLLPHRTYNGARDVLDQLSAASQVLGA